MRPGGELQKTCPLSPSNSKIWAADLQKTQKKETMWTVNTLSDVLV